MKKKPAQRGPGRPPYDDAVRLEQVTIRLNASQRAVLARVGAGRVRQFLDSLAAK